MSQRHTSEGHVPEARAAEPAEDDLGPERVEHGSDDVHAAADHGEDHGRDDHANGDDPLGGFDLQAWGAAALGTLLGLVVAVCLLIASPA